MKKLILMTVGILMFTLSNGQTNFKWEKTDSVAKTKEQIYSDTKMFIAEYWKSAQNVIQNDDKEAGIILVKGSSTKTIKRYDFTYNYNVTFKMRDNKYKIILDNVYNDKTYVNGYTASSYTIEPFDNYTKTKITMDTPLNISGNNKILMMSTLKQDLQSIVDSYEKYIKKPSVSNGDW